MYVCSHGGHRQIKCGLTRCTDSECSVLLPCLTDVINSWQHMQYFHAIMSYGIIFWGQSPDSLKIFLLQKRVIRTMMGCGGRDWCRRLFVELGILTLPSKYIFCLLLFVVKNKKLFSSNKDLHSIDARQQLNLHQPSAHLKKYQLGPYYMGIKLFNTLPATLKNESHNPARFRSLLKKFLLETTLYLLDEFHSICKPRKP
jgi:hypothetical protein